jgi:hypothetical protein
MAMTDSEKIQKGISSLIRIARMVSERVALVDAIQAEADRVSGAEEMNTGESNSMHDALEALCNAGWYRTSRGRTGR